MSKTCDRLANNRCVLFFLCLLRWIPVLFITTCIAWSYYAYVYELCVKTVSNTLEKCLYLFLYHIVLGIFVWSYYQVTFTNLGVPPKHFGIPDDLYERIITAQNVHTRRALLEDFARNLPVVTRTYDGSIRFCDRCRIVKPDRCHHCSVCRQCVMKMDHHCPWVNTCVSFTNYKFFILFLGYAMVYCLYVALTDLKYFIGFWTDGYANDSGSAAGKFHIMFLFFVACMFFISVSVLFWYHIWLSCMNRSTLESFRSPVFRSGPDKNGFNLGYRANFQEVFGDRTFLWFLPVFTALGDGLSYPTRSSSDAEYAGLLQTPPPWRDTTDESSEDEVLVTQTNGDATFINQKNAAAQFSDDDRFVRS